jgi:hypothetical protein
MKESEKLNACPFCGLKRFIIHSTPSRDKTIIWHRITHEPTVNCSVSMIEDNKGILIEKWNNRK